MKLNCPKCKDTKIQMETSVTGYNSSRDVMENISITCKCLSCEESFYFTLSEKEDSILLETHILTAEGYISYPYMSLLR